MPDSLGTAFLKISKELWDLPSDVSGVLPPGDELAGDENKRFCEGVL
jgi:hypothetical protein